MSASLDADTAMTAGDIGGWGLSAGSTEDLVGGGGVMVGIGGLARSGRWTSPAPRMREIPLLFSRLRGFVGGLVRAREMGGLERSLLERGVFVREMGVLEARRRST